MVAGTRVELGGRPAGGPPEYLCECIWMLSGVEGESVSRSGIAYNKKIDSLVNKHISVVLIYTTWTDAIF